MGQHKTNPVALAAKRGELPPIPKQENFSQVELQRYVYQSMLATIATGRIPTRTQKGENPCIS